MPAPFVEIRLPDSIARRPLGGPRFNTEVKGTANGFEQRNQNWELAKGSWDIGYGIRNQALLDLVLDFFYARRGRLVGFRMKDWNDFEIGKDAPQFIGLGDDVTTVFQVFKRYTSGGVDYDRPIAKLVSGTTKVFLDGVEQVAGFTVNDNTGEITFSVAPASTGGTGPLGEVIVSVQAEFDVPVRFDTDQIDIETVVFDVGRVPRIPIVEIRVI